MRAAFLPRLRKMALVLLGLLLSCGIVELTLRGIEATPLRHLLPVAQANLYGPAPLAGYGLRANSSGMWTTENRVPITINAQGLRNPPLSERTGTLPRVFALGDSIVEALQVPQDDMFTVLASRRLHADGTVEAVVNLGLSGASLPTQLWRYISKSSLPELAPRAGDVVIFNQRYSDFLAPSTAGTAEYVGYDRPAGSPPGAPLEVSRPFLQSRAFQLRSSRLGEVIYSAMEHSRLALVLNQRKNVGLLAELQKASDPSPSTDDDACQTATRKALEDAARHLLTADASTWTVPERRMAAWISDVQKHIASQGLDVVIAVRDLSGGCLEKEPTGARGQWAMTRESLTALFASYGISLWDVDLWLVDHSYTVDSESDLHGFETSRKTGHLNQHGHRVWSQMYQDMIKRTLAP